MAEIQPRVGEQRPGGRAERVRAAVLAATSELLAEVGYEAMSVEDVASRAGVHKTTVYRRWPTKSELVADAVLAHSDEHVPIPNTGNMLDDFRRLAREIVANIGSPKGGLRTRSIVAAATASEGLASGMHAMWAERLRLSAAIVDRAIERGELPAGSDANLIIETLIGPLWVRLLLTGEPLDDELADRVAELVAAGASSLPIGEPAAVGDRPK